MRLKTVSLDIDGVLRSLRAGGSCPMMIDGELAIQTDTSDFISAALLALRRIIETTGALVVLSSEWRRDEVMRKGMDDTWGDYDMRPCVSWTPTDLARDRGTDNPFEAFTERRARGISGWLAKNPQVKQWVVLDDINMATVDEDRRPGASTVGEDRLLAPRKHLAGTCFPGGSGPAVQGMSSKVRAHPADSLCRRCARHHLVLPSS